MGSSPAPTRRSTTGSATAACACTIGGWPALTVRVAAPSGVNGQIYDESQATGAVVAGRGTVEPAGYWGGDNHNGVPIFILSRRDPDPITHQWPLITYVSDVRSAMVRAREAAGERNVLVHGAGVAQLALS